MKPVAILRFLSVLFVILQGAIAFLLEPRDCCKIVGSGNTPNQFCAGETRQNSVLIEIEGTPGTPCCGYGRNKLYQH
jgi:hypothetical protein